MAMKKKIPGNINQNKNFSFRDQNKYSHAQSVFFVLILICPL